jgi:hypothetical protein
MTESNMPSNLSSTTRRLRHWSLAVTMFLLSFQPFLTMYSPRPELVETVPPAFASVYLKLSDIPLILTQIIFLATERQRFFSIPRSLRIITIPTLLLAGLTLISIPQARLPLLTIVAALRFLVAVGLAIAVSKTEPGWVMWPLIASAIASAVLGMFQYALRSSVGLVFLGEAQINAHTFGVPVVVSEGIYYLRALGFTVHPNVLAPYLVAAIVLLLASALRRYPADPWPETLGIGLACAGLALTYSRASWISMFLGTAIVVGGHWLQRSLRPRLKALIHPGIVMLLVLGMFMSTQSYQIASRFGFGTGGTTSETDRGLLLQQALALFRQHPVRGIGGHNFAVEAERNFEITDAYSHDFKWQPVHNLMALAATELGIGGGTVWLWLTLAPMVLAVVVWWRYGLDSFGLAWLAICTFLIWGGLLDHYVWTLPEGIGLMWTTWASLLAALDRRRAIHTSDTDRPSLAPLPLPRPSLAIDWKALATITAVFVGSRLLLAATVWVGASLLPLAPGTHPPPVFANTPILDGLVRWNSGWYESVASHGYFIDPPSGATNIAFLPVYPIVVRAITAIVGNVFVGGLATSNIAFLLVLFLLYRLIRNEEDSRTARWAVLFVAAAPLGILFSAMYPDSLLVLFVLATFYYARQGRWLAAGLAGALAALTDMMGLAASIIIAIEAMSKAGIRFRPAGTTLRDMARHYREQFGLLHSTIPGLLVSLLPPACLLTYVIGIGITFRRPGVYFEAMAAWQSILLFDPLNIIFLAALLPLAFNVTRTMRPAWAAYTIAILLVGVLNANTLITLPHSTLLLVPCYVVLARWARQRRTGWLLLVLSLAVMAYFAMRFAGWYWIG